MAAALPLPELLESWLLALRAERKSVQTVKTYGDGVRRFFTWCEQNHHPITLDRPTVDAFIVDLLDAGTAPATARSRHLALKRFSAWLVEEGETDRDALVTSKPPKLDTPVTPGLTDDQLRALLETCRGSSFCDRRDTALVRLLAETGLRAGEVTAMRRDDLDVPGGTAVIRRGKGGKGRVVPFSPQTGQALDRYLRTRRTHRLAATPALWLGDRGKELAYHGLRKALGERAAAAGLDGFHLHLLRHTAATRWLAAGGSEGGLMAVAGWSRREMLDRYTRATAAERAADEARGLGLGEL